MHHLQQESMTHMTASWFYSREFHLAWAIYPLHPKEKYLITQILWYRAEGTYLVYLARNFNLSTSGVKVNHFLRVSLQKSLFTSLMRRKKRHYNLPGI